MKHFPTGVGLVLHLQLGEPLKCLIWVTIIERMGQGATGVILPPVCSVNLGQHYF